MNHLLFTLLGQMIPSITPPTAPSAEDDSFDVVEGTGTGSPAGWSFNLNGSFGADPVWAITDQSGPGTASIDPATGILTLTDGGAGTKIVNGTLTDSTGLSDVWTATITIVDPPSPTGAIVSQYLVGDDIDMTDDVGAVDGLLIGSWDDLTVLPLLGTGHSVFKFVNNVAHGRLAASNPAHAFNAMSIEIPLQPIANTAKGVIACGSSPLSNASGDWSIERNADGSPRAFVANSAGVPQFFTTEEPGSKIIVGHDLTVGSAHLIHLTFGGGEAKLYVNKALVATVTGIAGAWNNGIHKCFGVWQDGTLSPYAGALDQITIWDYALNQTEITARTAPTTRTMPSPPVDPNAQSVNPPATVHLWVRAGGSGNQSGSSAANAMPSIAQAMRTATSGQTIAVLGGIYDDASNLNQTISNKNFASTVQVIGYGTEPIKIDNSFKQFRGPPFNTLPVSRWTQTDAAKNIWISSGVNVGTSAPHGFGPDGDGVPSGQRLRLVSYFTDVQFETNSTNTANGYQGPGLRLSGTNVRIRTATARWSNELGHGSFPTNKNPNQQDIVVFGNDTIWTFSNCSNIEIKFIELLYCNKCVNLLGSSDIAFRYCQFEGKADYFFYDATTHDITVDHCKFHFNMPEYVAHRSWKGSDIQGAYDGKGSMKGPQKATMSATVHPKDFIITNNEFFRCLMPVNFWSMSSGHVIKNNHFLAIRDDPFSVSYSSHHIEVAYNWFERCQWIFGLVSEIGTLSGSNCGRNYFHHNVAMIAPYYRFADGTGNAFTEPAGNTTAMQVDRIYLGHSSGEINAAHWKFYYNTFIAGIHRDANLLGMGIEHWATVDNAPNPQDPNQIHNMFNNIFVQQSSNHEFFKNSRFDEDNICDGNVYHRPISQSTDMFTSLASSGGSVSGSFSQVRANTAFINGTKALYAPGWEASGLNTNPNFVGGGSSTYGSYVFDSRTKYRPQAAAVLTGAVNITARGFPGGGSYQAWRGALDPDGDGSEVGIQP